MPSITPLTCVRRLWGAENYHRWGLTVDILSFPELQDSIFYLHDIDGEHLARTKRLIDGIVARHNLPTRVERG